MVVLILEDPNTEMVYYNRVKEIATLHNFDTEYITPEILHLVEEKCQYLELSGNQAFNRLYPEHMMFGEEDEAWN